MYEKYENFTHVFCKDVKYRVMLVRKISLINVDRSTYDFVFIISNHIHSKHLFSSNNCGLFIIRVI